MEVARVRVLRTDRRQRIEFGAAEEGHLDVPGEHVEAEEPAPKTFWPLDPVERRIPLHRLAHAGHGLLDQLVELAPRLALPSRHRRDIGLHRRIALTLGDLRVAAGKKLRPSHPASVATLDVMRNASGDETSCCSYG